MTIHFKPNEPQTLSLKETSGVMDGFYVLYETADGKTLQLPRPAAIKLNELDPRPGEEFAATKHQESAKHPQEWTFSLTARSEQIRAQEERAAELAERTRQDLAGQLQASLIGKGLSEVPHKPPGRALEPFREPKGTGTWGPVPQVAPGRRVPPGRVSYRVALKDIAQAVTGLLKESGEQWNDQAKQDLVSTAFISWAKTGGIVFDVETEEVPK